MRHLKRGAAHAGMAAANRRIYVVRSTRRALAAVPPRASSSPQKGDVATRSSSMTAIQDPTPPPNPSRTSDDALFHTLIMASPLAIFMIGVDGRVRLWNPAAEKMFGWSADAALGFPDPTVPPGSEDATDLVRLALSGEAVTDRLVLRRRQDGAKVDVSLSCARICNALGRPEGVMMIAADVTDRRRLELERGDLLEREQRARAVAEEAERRAREAVRARERLLAVVSHDLRNSLATVLLNSTAILDAPRTGGLNEAELEQIQWVVRSAEQMSRLISDLLDVSTIESGRLSVEPTPQGVEPIVWEALEMCRPLATEKKLQCRATVDDGISGVLVDAARIQQVLSNLLGNAVKFCEPGGSIEVRVSSSGGEVQFAVADSGQGIPPEHLESIFELYWQGQRGRQVGAGLGLAIAKAIVEAHGGRVWADSEIGRGSVFYFTVPAAPSGAATP